MTSFLLCAALALSGSLDNMLDRFEQEPEPIHLSARLVPSSLDPDVVWLPEEAGSRDSGHWIPPLRLGLTEKEFPQNQTLQESQPFHWMEWLERTYYLPTAGQFARQRLPFEITLQVDASGSDRLALQMELSTTVVDESNAKSPARWHIRSRSAQAQMLAGQTLVVTNLYAYEEVLPILQGIPVLGSFFQPSTTGPMLLLKAEPF